MRRDSQPITRAEWKAAYESMKRDRDRLEDDNKILKKALAQEASKQRSPDKVSDLFLIIDELLKG